MKIGVCYAPNHDCSVIYCLPCPDIVQETSVPTDLLRQMLAPSKDITVIRGSCRAGEIGLRIALGARASQVISRVLREAFWVTGAGIVVGLIAALWLRRFVRVMLYGLAGTDALTVGVAAALLTAVSLLAAFAPARRASRIDPIRALSARLKCGWENWSSLESGLILRISNGCSDSKICTECEERNG